MLKATAMLVFAGASLTTAQVVKPDPVTITVATREGVRTVVTTGNAVGAPGMKRILLGFAASSAIPLKLQVRHHLGGWVPVKPGQLLLAAGRHLTGLQVALDGVAGQIHLCASTSQTWVCGSSVENPAGFDAVALLIGPSGRLLLPERGPTLVRPLGIHAGCNLSLRIDDALNISVSFKGTQVSVRLPLPVPSPWHTNKHRLWVEQVVKEGRTKNWTPFYTVDGGIEPDRHSFSSILAQTQHPLKSDVYLYVKAAPGRCSESLNIRHIAAPTLDRTRFEPDFAAAPLPAFAGEESTTDDDAEATAASGDVIMLDDDATVSVLKEKFATAVTADDRLEAALDLALVKARRGELTPWAPLLALPVSEKLLDALMALGHHAREPMTQFTEHEDPRIREQAERLLKLLDEE